MLYTIELNDGRTVRRHQDHVQKHHDMLPEPLLVIVEPVAESLSNAMEVQQELDTDTSQSVLQSQECVMLEY